MRACVKRATIWWTIGRIQSWRSPDAVEAHTFAAQSIRIRGSRSILTRGFHWQRWTVYTRNPQPMNECDWCKHQSSMNCSYLNKFDHQESVPNAGEIFDFPSSILRSTITSKLQFWPFNFREKEGKKKSKIVFREKERKKKGKISEGLSERPIKSNWFGSLECLSFHFTFAMV